MVHLLLVLVPLGLASSVSPVMLTEQTVLLAAPGGRRTGLLYAAGTAAVLVVLVGGILFLGNALKLPTAPHLNASLDLAVGGLLLAIAVVLRLRKPAGKQRGRDRERLGPLAAFGFGVFSMATNFTTLALVVPAAKEVAASRLSAWEGAVAAALLVVLACLPAWGPVAFETAAPETAHDVLERLERLIRRHGRRLAVLFLGAAGLLLVARGIVRMAGL